jgi:uncharacterized protein
VTTSRPEDPGNPGNAGNNDTLDETLEETFPASDAPANTVETGVRPAPAAVEGVGPSAMSAAAVVVDNGALHRFEATVDGQTAFLIYERTADTLTLIHTEVPAPLRGGHLADRLVAHALRVGQSEGLRIVAICPFARDYMWRHRA